MSPPTPPPEPTNVATSGPEHVAAQPTASTTEPEPMATEPAPEVAASVPSASQPSASTTAPSSSAGNGFYQSGLGYIVRYAEQGPDWKGVFYYGELYDLQVCRFAPRSPRTLLNVHV